MRFRPQTPRIPTNSTQDSYAHRPPVCRAQPTTFRTPVRGSSPQTKRSFKPNTVLTPTCQFFSDAGQNTKIRDTLNSAPPATPSSATRVLTLTPISPVYVWQTSSSRARRTGVSSSHSRRHTHLVRDKCVPVPHPCVHVLTVRRDDRRPPIFPNSGDRGGVGCAAHPSQPLTQWSNAHTHCLPRRRGQVRCPPHVCDRGLQCFF